MQKSSQFIDDFISNDIPKCFVRLKINCWVGKNGTLNYKISIKPLIRKGSDFIIDEANNFGANEVALKIINLLECHNGIYEIITCNHSKDWETGIIDDWDYKLIHII